MKFNDYIIETAKQFVLYVDKDQTNVLDDAPPWLHHSLDDYMQYVEVYIKAKDNSKDYVALLVGVNQEDSDFKVIDKNIHIDKANKELLQFIKLSDSELNDLSTEEAELVTS